MLATSYTIILTLLGLGLAVASRVSFQQFGAVFSESGGLKSRLHERPFHRSPVGRRFLQQLHDAVRYAGAEVV